MVRADRLANGKTRTGFANSEEDDADAFVRRQIQPQVHLDYWFEPPKR
jgi:hypothetical protein